MKQIVAKQRAFFQTNATKNLKFRFEQLRKLERAIKENEALLYDAIYKDFKKSEFDTYTAEISLLYHDIRTALKNIKEWSRTKKVPTNIVNLPGRSYIVPEPLGVSLILGAWNYPYQLSLAPAIAALAAGNTVILKPSELPENTSKAMAKMIADHFEPEYFTVVEGGIPETTQLLEQKFDKIFFTGSIPVGKIIYQAAAKQLTPVTLELGGKSPAIFTEGCKLKISVKRFVWGKFLNAGQTCIAPDYALVHESIIDDFKKEVINEIKNAHLAISNDNYVQIINDKNLERLAGLIDQSKVIYGGKIDKELRTIEPTVMDNVSFDDKVMQDEIFGPILPIVTYKNLNEAISKINSLPKPLACYAFTKNNKTKKRILNEVSFGGGCVNDSVMHITNDNFGFGGVGNSGIGAYHGEEGFKTFSHFKSVFQKSTLLEPSLKYYPQTPLKLKIIKFLMKL